VSKELGGIESQTLKFFSVLPSGPAEISQLFESFE